MSARPDLTTKITIATIVGAGMEMSILSFMISMNALIYLGLRGSWLKAFAHKLARLLVSLLKADSTRSFD
jgi:hypothetical protein